MILLLLFPVTAFAQPAIIFDAETYDFGTVKGDEPLKHVFEVRNDGTEDLVIKKLEAP
jgi:hypothetical protein